MAISFEPQLFNRLMNKGNITAQISKIKGIGLDQREVLGRTIAQANGISEQEFATALAEMFTKMQEGNFSGGVDAIKKLIPNQAAIKQTSLGTAVMADNWSKPVVFPSEKTFKMLGWADKPSELTTEQLWTSAYGSKPALTMGAVGNSNIKPEQVKGGCSLSKKELSAKYEQAIQDFYNPIIGYLKECGVKSEDIGFAFAHSDCGVDKAARAIVEKHKLKGFATTPTEYTQYLRGKEFPPCEEFPNGYILADFPFPTILTRNAGQIDDYATVYGKMVGRDMPLGVFGGGEHAFSKDAKYAVFTKEGAKAIPVDIMKDKFDIVIPAIQKDAKGEEVVTNAALYMKDKVNGNPYEQYIDAFEKLPKSKFKKEIENYNQYMKKGNPQMAITAIAYSNLAKAGKI